MSQSLVCNNFNHSSSSPFGEFNFMRPNRQFTPWNKNNFQPQINQNNNNQNQLLFPPQTQNQFQCEPQSQSQSQQRRSQAQPQGRPQSQGHSNTNNKRRRRKRKLEETDIEDSRCDVNDIDGGSSYLQFNKPSNKRMRTNSMTNKVRRDINILHPEFERNIYNFDPSQPRGNDNTKTEIEIEQKENQARDFDRTNAPYIDKVHPYLRRQSEINSNNNLNNNNNKIKDKSPSPAFLFNNNPKIDGFELTNKQNGNNTEWKEKIESQLADKRNERINDLYGRLQNVHGLGRDVLIAKCRKELPLNIFNELCQRLNYYYNSNTN